MPDQITVIVVGLLSFASFIVGWILGVSDRKQFNENTDHEHGRNPL